MMSARGVHSLPLISFQLPNHNKDHFRQVVNHLRVENEIIAAFDPLLRAVEVCEAVSVNIAPDLDDILPLWNSAQDHLNRIIASLNSE
jgi:hypothetical protein